MLLSRWHCRIAAVMAICLLAAESVRSQIREPVVPQPPMQPASPASEWAGAESWFGGQASDPVVHTAQRDLGYGSPLPLEPLEALPPFEPPPVEVFEPADWPTGDLAPFPGWYAAPIGDGFWYRLGGKARGYYANDQRIEFTGQESSFAVEGVIDGGVRQQCGVWEWSLEGELFLNQPFDRNILTDTRIRRSFAANFDVEPLQISQLYLGARHGDFYAAIGRFVTPFGRFYYPLYRNNFDDSPFIRSDAILYRETGLVLQWDPAWWVFTAALTNGGFEQDTNSSKALVARIGIDQPYFALGASIKAQDGIGSEGHKAFKEHVGLDAMVRRGAWTLSAEVIYDNYGLRRPGTDLTDIFWGRSLYFRDLNLALDDPITGVGYYVDLTYDGPLWTLMLNYGEYYPSEIGDPRHDQAIHRGIVKASRHWTRHFETYGGVLIENDREDDLDTHSRRGVYVLAGGQFSL